LIILGLAMPEISKKNRKFIKRNFKHLPLEELARHTGLEPDVIRSLIDQCTGEVPGKDQSSHIGNGPGILPSWETIILISLLFAAVVTIIYSPSLHGDFVFDDEVIQDNPLIHITRILQLTDLIFSKEISRRIGLMSFALNYSFGGLNTFGYHLVNVTVHILNGLILFLLSYTILTLPLDEGKGRGNALKISFMGSLLWLVHPIQTQAVAYIVQRLTSLSALFFMLSLLCYIKGRVHHTSRRLFLLMLSLLFGLLALGTKQNAATLPLFIILSEFFFLQQKPFKLDKKKLGFITLLGGLFILISGIYLRSDFISRIALQYQERGWTPLERVLTQLRVVIFYLSLLVYPNPSRLNIDHDFAISPSLLSPFTTFLSLLVILGSLAFALFFMKRNRLVSYAFLWFFGNLVIESSIIPLELVFEHRIYLPSMGLIILVVGLCFSLSKREWEKWVSGFIILLIFLFSYWTYERASVWRGPLPLWMDAAKKSPYKARPHNALGYAYEYNKGMLDEAISEYKHALAINPNYFKAHNNLGVAYAKKGMLDEAISEYKKTLAIKPRYVDAHNNLGVAYSRKGMFDEAIAEYKRALSLKPRYPEAHFNLGNAYDKMKSFDKAIAEYKRALLLKPHYADARNNLGATYSSKGMFDEAISEYKQALAINPHHARAHFNLGTAYYKKGELDKAISEYKQAIVIKPDYGDAHNNLAVAYYSKGNYRLAIVHCDKAVELRVKVNPKLLKLLKPYR